MGMLHKIRGKSLISLKSPSPFPLVLPCYFIQDILPNPPSPFVFQSGWNTLIADRHMVCTFNSCICCCPNFFCISLCLFYWVIWSCTCNNEFRLKRPIFGGGDSKGVRNRLQKAHGALQMPWKVWATTGKRKANQDTPIQDLGPTGPSVRFWNMKDHCWKKTEQFQIPIPKRDSKD